jgi:hypothetical protein
MRASVDSRPVTCKIVRFTPPPASAQLRAVWLCRVAPLPGTNWKALSQRIGHADVAFTMKQYVQTDLEADRQVANTLAELIIGGSLTSFEITGTAG